jgi:chromatin structure-remodeling complex subunit RSC1/2
VLLYLLLPALLAHYADHPIEDLIEKIACQFTAQHIKGRPRPPFWYPGFPLYVCDSQYNDCERVFVKITNWNGCIPEEVQKEESGGGGGEGREEEFMPVYPFEKIIWPKKVGSPFLVGRGGSMKGVKGPGGIVNDPVGNGVNGAVGDGDNTRKKLRSPGRTQQQQQQQQQPPPATTTAMATLQTAHAAQSQNPYQHFQQPYMQQQQQQIVNQPQAQRSTTLGPDRSIISAAGGIAAIGGSSQVEKLPADTGKFFLCFVFLLFWTFVLLFPYVILVFSFLLLTSVFYICSETI